MLAQIFAQEKKDSYIRKIILCKEKVGISLLYFHIDLIVRQIIFNVLL